MHDVGDSLRVLEVAGRDLIQLAPFALDILLNGAEVGAARLLVDAKVLPEARTFLNVLVILFVADDSQDEPRDL